MPTVLCMDMSNSLARGSKQELFGVTSEKDCMPSGKEGVIGKLRALISGEVVAMMDISAPSRWTSLLARALDGEAGGERGLAAGGSRFRSKSSIGSSRKSSDMKLPRLDILS